MGAFLFVQVRMDESQLTEASDLRQRLQQEFELLSAYQSKTRAQLESQLQRERRDLEQRVSLRRAVIQQQVITNCCMSTRDAGYMRICDRICDSVFAKTHISHIFPHIMAFSKLHMQKIAYMLYIFAYAIAFFSIFLVQLSFNTVKYFGGRRLPVFAIRRWMQNWPINDHDYDFLSLGVACAGNMPKNMRHMLHIWHIYVPHISPNSAYFALKSSAYFKKIYRYKPASLVYLCYKLLSL